MNNWVEHKRKHDVQQRTPEVEQKAVKGAFILFLRCKPLKHWLKGHDSCKQMDCADSREITREAIQLHQAVNL